MASQLPAATPVWHPGTLPQRSVASARRHPAPALPTVAISRRARAAWAPLCDIAYATPGTVIVGLDGTTLRIREDGGAEEVSAVPRRWSISADPTAREGTE